MNKLKTIIWEHLPWIDEILEERSTPIYIRAFHASIMFVNIVIVSVSTGTKEEFINSELFSTVVNPTIDWYIEKYGVLAKNPEKETLSGIVLYRNQPVLLNIPTTTNRVEEEGETAWLTFPDKLQPDELHSDLFDLDINLDNLSVEELEKLKAEIEEIVALSRRTYISLMTQSKQDESVINKASIVWQHIENAISGILSNKKTHIPPACWELYFAIELLFKAYLCQFIEEKDLPHVHKFSRLYELANEHGLNFDQALLNEFPTSENAIKMRYNQIQVNQKDAIKLYQTTLKIICSISNQLNRRFSIYNASFLIKKTPWAK